MSIFLEDITKYFGSQKVLDKLSLKIKKGEFHVILGPSGEGKSTLLSIIAGLLKPDKGNIWIDGQLVNELPPQKRQIGFVFQDFALFPHLTVFENVAYGLKARGVKNNKLKERICFYLNMVGLDMYRDKYPPELSGGQKQRVALARALAINPRLLLLDEPLSHIDAWQQEKLREDLKQIQQNTGVTTIYVTHDQLEARVLADRVSILHQGRIEQVEPPEELFYQPKTGFVANFIGATNILDGYVSKMNDNNVKFKIKDSDLTITVKKYPIFQDKRQIRLCLHPEKIILSLRPEKENHFLGVVEDIKLLGITARVNVNIRGLKIKAIVPRKHISSITRQTSVWVCFSSDVPHPLCGRCHRLPPHLRRCNQCRENKQKSVEL